MAINTELERWFRRVSMSMLGEYPSLIATYELARSLVDREVPGDFVECGIFAGAEVAAMAKALMVAGATDRRVHLFDSFEGIPQPGPEDLEFVAAGTQKGGASCPMPDVRRNMRDWGVPEGLLVYHPGWFHETLPAADVGAIALLRLDGDLYESTQPCMKHLYPKLSVGGWCILDDYPLSGARKAMQEVVMPQPIYWQKVK